MTPAHKQVDRELLLRGGKETDDQCLERCRLADLVYQLEMEIERLEGDVLAEVGRREKLLDDLCRHCSCRLTHDDGCQCERDA